MRPIRYPKSLLPMTLHLVNAQQDPPLVPSATSSNKFSTAWENARSCDLLARISGINNLHSSIAAAMIIRKICLALLVLLFFILFQSGTMQCPVPPIEDSCLAVLRTVSEAIWKTLNRAGTFYFSFEDFSLSILATPEIATELSRQGKDCLLLARHFSPFCHRKL